VSELVDPAINHSVLADLVDTAKSGARGFALAARDNREPGIAEVLQEGEDASREAIVELEEQMQLLGAAAPESAVTGAPVYRGWINFNAVSIHRDTKLILEECERGADYAQRRYETALKLELPESGRTIVQRQYQRVIAIQSRLRLLRNRYPATAVARGSFSDPSSGQRSQ
jgi:uncharacterized protein (TIGR02284 family)